MFSPLVAFDADSLIGLAFVIFWVLAWVFKLATGQAQKGPPVPNRPRPPARPRDEKLQEEIDIFIQEVGPKKGTRRAPPTPARTGIPTQPSGPAARTKQPTQLPAAGKKPAPRRARPGEEIATRHMPDTETDMGSGVKRHLAQHMAERVTQEAAAYLKPQLDQSVAEHLGQGSPPTPQQATVAVEATTRETVRTGGRFGELLRNPAHIRQAMVVSLILAPPPGLAARPAAAFANRSLPAVPSRADEQN